MGAEVMAALDWLPAPERKEPQEFPACATHFSQRPLPRALGPKTVREKVPFFFTEEVQLDGQTFIMSCCYNPQLSSLILS